jgi:PAS domain S-box-containing protein
MHRLLKRQINRFLGQTGNMPEGFSAFLDAVDAAYRNYDTDYQQLERTLEISAKESFKELSDLRTAISQAIMVLIADANGKIIFTNHKFLDVSGYAEEELTGMEISTLFSDFHQDSFYSEIRLALQDGKVWKGEMKDRSKSGKYYWTDTTIVPLLNDMKKPYRYIFFKIDISKIKDAETEVRQYAHHLEKINKELDQFAYVVSHDLKAPLRAINNLSEWIEEDITETAEKDTMENIRLLRGRVIRMEALIEGILQYSRAGRIKKNYSNVNLGSLIHDIIDSYTTDNRIRFIYPDNLPIIYSERVILEQIFGNLISNAIKYNNAPNPTVNINFANHPDSYTFTVTDNGPGIAPEYHEKIFVIFQTLQARDKFESTGVGLAIVKKLVGDAGGNIEVRSTPGKGSTFSFTLPKRTENS